MIETSKTNECLAENTAITPEEDPVFRRKIGGMTYLVRVHFNNQAAESLQQKLEKLLRDEVRYMEPSEGHC